MDSKYTREHSTGYKVGGLKLVAEKMFRVQIHFFAKTAGNNTASFSEFFTHFPKISVKYSRFVIESYQVNC